LTAPGLAEIVAELDRLGIRYVVVGGGAVAAQYSVGTQDVDILVAAEEYQPSLSKLDESPQVKWVEKSPGMATVLFHGTGGDLELDVIDTTMYSGDREPDAFVRFVRSHASVAIRGVRFATVPAVWYMRLLVPDWQIYLTKVQADLAFGVPPKFLDEAAAIADRFGCGDVIRERVGSVRAEVADEVRRELRREA
jgi:hypothetical protein